MNGPVGDVLDRLLAGTEFSFFISADLCALTPLEMYFLGICGIDAHHVHSEWDSSLVQSASPRLLKL